MRLEWCKRLYLFLTLGLLLWASGAVQAATYPEGFEGTSGASLTGTNVTWVAGSHFTTSTTQAQSGSRSLKITNTSAPEYAGPNVTDGLGGNYTAVTWAYAETAGAQLVVFDRATAFTVSSLTGGAQINFDSSTTGTGGFGLTGTGARIAFSQLAAADIPVGTWLRYTRIWQANRVRVEIFRTSAAPNGGHYLTTNAWQTGQTYVFDSTDATLPTAASGYNGVLAYAATGVAGYFDDLSLTSGAATTYNVSAPTRGPTGTASSNFTVSVSGTLAANTVVTPSAANGTFSPTSVTLTAGSNPSASFTYTPASTGAKTISFANDQGLTNPASIVYNSLYAYVVTSANWYHSPANWYSDGAGAMQANNCKASSTYVQSNAPGGYGRLAFTGTLAQLNLTETQLANTITVMYSIDGGLPQLLTLSSSSTLIDFTPTPLASGAHTIFYQFNGSSLASNDRWTNAGGPGNTLRITSFWSDASSLTAPTLRSKVAWFFGDSITEAQACAGGVWTTYTGTLLFQGGLTQSWWWIVGDALNAEVGVCGYSGQGILTNAGGSLGNIPTFINAWDKYDGLAGHGRDFTNKPDYVFVNLGTNDGLNSGGNFISTLNTFLTNFRVQCPSTKIFLIVPFGQFRSSQIYATTRDANTFILDNGAAGAVGLDNSGVSAVAADTSGSFVHPNIWGNLREAQMILKQLPAYTGGTISVKPVHK